MLTKLAIQNIKSSKGYFIAYILTVAIFFTIVYQMANIEIQLNSFFVDEVAKQNIKISDMFLYLKYFLYLIILFFASYVSRFFIKRRSNEVALLKTLGLNRRNIWYVFLIENAIIVVAGLIIGIIFGVIFSRIIAIVAMDIIGLKLTTINFTLSNSGLLDVGLIALIVYLIIGYVPLKTVSKSSIIELFKEQVSNEKHVKKSSISLIIFIVSLLALLYLMLVYIPNPKLIFKISDVVIYFGVAIIVAYFLYQGAMSFYFARYQSKHSGINSPVRLLSFNHLASNFGGVIKMMSIITIISAMVSISIIASFGYLNTQNKKSLSAEEGELTLKFVSNNKNKSDELYKKLSKIDSKTKQYNLHIYGKLKLKEIDGDMEKESDNVIVVKQSDYDSIKKDSNDKSKDDSNKVIASEVIGNLNSKRNQYIKEVLDYSGTDVNQLVSTGTGVVNTLRFVGLHDTYAKLYKSKENNLFSMFYNPFVIILPDDNKIFNKLDHVTLIDLSNDVSKENVYEFFNLMFVEKISLDKNIVSLNGDAERSVEDIIIIGLFQVVLLLASLVTIIALMMAIFFRTLENLEKGVSEYVIAKQIGLRQKQVIQSLFIEAFVTQILPFVLGSVVSILMFIQLIKSSLDEGMQLHEVLLEPQIIIIFSTIITFLIILLCILLITITKKINETKEIKMA